MKSFLLAIVFVGFLHGCRAQQGILYNLDQGIIDSLTVGMRQYQGLLSDSRHLKFYILLKKDGDSLELYLQEYSTLPKSGFLNLIKSSNRYIPINGNEKIPIIFDEDIFSMFIKQEGIVRLPYTGYYIKAIKLQEGYRVAETQFLF